MFINGNVFAVFFGNICNKEYQMKNILQHYLFSFLLITGIPLIAFAQGTSKKDEPRSWYQLDKIQDHYYGISLDKAYQYVKGKKSKEIIVAVLDNGIDTLHEDLKNVLWHNPKE